MEITDATIPGCKVITSTPVFDERGFFVRTMTADEFASAGIPIHAFVQHNQSRSARGTVRGIHFRTDGEGRLVRCARGAMFDVVVDLRPDSPAFGRWEAFVLDDVAHRQLYIPPGCGHAFQAISDLVDTCYQHTLFYDAAAQGYVRWNDPTIGIAWPEPVRLVSARDDAAPLLRDTVIDLRRWFGGLR